MALSLVGLQGLNAEREKVDSLSVIGICKVVDIVQSYSAHSILAVYPMKKQAA